MLQKAIKNAQARRMMTETVLDNLEETCAKITSDAQDISKMCRNITKKLKNGAGDAIASAFHNGV